MKIYTSILLTLIAAFIFFTSDVYACACCVDPGFYSIKTAKPDSYMLDELSKIRFADAKLYTPPGEDNVSGISPAGENYSIDGAMKNNIWKFSFKDDKGKSGILNLMKPVSMVAFMADIHDTPEGSETVLYKELRFKYKVQNGTGIFQKGIAPATEYFLVLQGRGNGCTQAEDFTHWRLEVTGKKANYSLYGKLER